MVVKQRAALVERPVACAGRGQYVALVYYGSRGGSLHHHVFRYSHRDPRQKGEAAVLRDIAQMVAARYRDFILAISVVKCCLHPKTDTVPKVDRTPHFERVFSWVVEHEHSRYQDLGTAKRQHLEHILEGQRVTPIMLPYTAHELREVSVKQVVTTMYWPKAHASISLRGVERRVTLQDILAA